MGRKALDLTGKIFGKLTAIERKGSYRSHPTWLCECECGKKCIKLGARLVSGKTKSCGCLTTATHGMSKHPLWGVWNAMIQRCHNPNTRSFKFYGAKGTEVCKEWRESSEEFLKWALPQWEQGLTIDRVDDRVGYCPNNCRFIPLIDNVLRKRVTGKNVGKVFGTWRVTGKIPKSSKMNVECIHCHIPDAFQQSNIVRIKCRQCDCSGDC
jgi:hypothetical protein